ncbi:hypothetical protein J2S57_005216 [Kineosporia succinea]|uniref:Uncharacterized protein n=1 Tax=Kineosporia succinea TaxID=84632 RepID=A0ABT9P9U0_9ACTN|nr:hypothetical protein [Kineosporia succinea]
MDADPRSREPRFFRGLVLGLLISAPIWAVAIIGAYYTWKA